MNDEFITTQGVLSYVAGVLVLLTLTYFASLF